jgi:DNA-binding CsgD family transcriptional regulator
LARGRGGQSAVLVIRGEAGIGKTELLEYCARGAADLRVERIVGVQSEFEMPFAALHQLCLPMSDRLTTLPAPQRLALQVAFGAASGSTPDRFTVGLAVLSLLAEEAAHQPLVILVDDAQWLDRASSRVLEFVGRRLLAEAVVLLFAVREVGDERLFPALVDLTLRGLGRDDAEALLSEAVPGQLDDWVRDRIVAETGGNPLALLELTRGISAAELAGGFSAPATAGLRGVIEDHYLRRVRKLPELTQLLLLLAAADPTGDAALVWRAAESFAICRPAAAAAESDELITIRSRVRFRHPLIRSTVYAAATPEDRAAAHRALAAATHTNTDPERRVWHLATATTGPDEEVASQLEQTARQVEARAGLAAAAAFLRRAAELSAEPERRSDRALAAARANLQAGAFPVALDLVAEAAAFAVSDLQRAGVEQLRGQIESASNPGSRAPVVLLRAARRLESLDVSLSRSTYLDAWFASVRAGRLAAPGGHLIDVACAARSAPRPRQRRSADLLLDGLTTLVLDGRAAAEQDLRAALCEFLRDDIARDEWFLRGTMAVTAAAMLWDFDAVVELSTRQVDVARAAGALAPLCNALSAHGLAAAWSGDLETAEALIRESDAAKEATGAHLHPPGALLVAAYRGRPEAALLISTVAERSVEGGRGFGSVMANWTTAVLENSRGRYAEAMAAAEQAMEDERGPIVTPWALPELIEAAVRSDEPGRAGEALAQLSAVTIAGSDWAKGIEARCRALVSEGPEAEHWYAEAVDRLARTRLRPELARARLLYGEWLRREKRRLDARRQLRTAHDMFVAMGAGAFAERAGHELLATGEKLRTREPDWRHELTPQQEHIVRLARDGRTNREIAAELFVSARTVEWHLGKAFMKLGVASRRGLKDALPAPGRQY